MTMRMGFACKYMHPDQNLSNQELKEIQGALTERSTTVAWCNRQNRQVAEQRLLDIVEHNWQAARRLVEYAGSLEPERRMVRLGSNQIPMATQSDWRYLWEDASNVQAMERGFAQVGDRARELGVRLSFHPGQFCVLASDRPDVVERSIDEFEYHARVARWMGYGRSFQDFKCNVHISGKLGAQGIRAVHGRLSPEARNIITIENDEFGWGLDESLKISDLVALVVDIHHHWVREGEYIQPDDPRLDVVKESWRGIRPVIHYSYSRDEHLPADFDHNRLPDMNTLLESGCRKQKLRAHSEDYPNPVANTWALSHLHWADIMCEAKSKNLAQHTLYQQAKASGLI